MVGAEAFVPNFVHAMEQQQNEQKVVVVMVLVGIARTLWRYWGKAAMEATIRVLACEEGVDPQEIFAQVEYQDQEPHDTTATTEDSGVSSNEASWRKTFGVDDIRLTPKRSDAQQLPPQPQPQQQQQQAASSSVIAIGQPGYVAQEVQKYEPKQDNVMEDDQLIHKTILASVQIGKGTPSTQQQFDPMQTNDAWCNDEKQNLQGQLATSNATIRQQQGEIDKLTILIVNTNKVGATPMVANIVTPTNQIINSPSPINYEIIWNSDSIGGNVGNRRTIIDGVIQREPRSPQRRGIPTTLWRDWEYLPTWREWAPGWRTGGSSW